MEQPDTAKARPRAWRRLSGVAGWVLLILVAAIFLITSLAGCIMIVGNAVYTIWAVQGNPTLGFWAGVGAPITYIVWPYVMPEGATTWPLAPGSQLWPWQLGTTGAWLVFLALFGVLYDDLP